MDGGDISVSILNLHSIAIRKINGAYFQQKSLRCCIYPAHPFQLAVNFRGGPCVIIHQLEKQQSEKHQHAKHQSVKHQHAKHQYVNDSLENVNPDSINPNNYHRGNINTGSHNPCNINPKKTQWMNG